MQEKIGNIILDEEFYPGKDLYCDGDIEDELLAVATTKSPDSFREIIEERESWPFLYHLSPIRENIVSWLPFKKTDKVLEVGSGCGAITGALCQNAGEVTCIDLSKKRSMINAYRHKDYDNCKIHVGNFKDIEKVLDTDYDYVCLIGVFEYAVGYMGTDSPFEDFLKILLKHMKKDGHLVIAIENRMGLKYLSGCKEDHSGKFFDGIEGYPNGGSARTFTRRGLEKIMKSCGVDEYQFYYPYPDYKFPNAIFSDERLPKLGELHDNIRNFDRERLILFDEQLAFDQMIREGSFEDYSNSYMVVIGPKLSVKYAKYSNDRDDKYAISTQIREEQGIKYVIKRPENELAKEHIDSMEQNYHKLCQRFEGSGLDINKLTRVGDEIRFEFVEGCSLEEIMDSYVAKDDKEGFIKDFSRYSDILHYNKEQEISDYDLIFQNIIVNGEQWTTIDYEWTYAQAQDPDEILTRAIWCYLLGSRKREKIKPWLEEWEKKEYQEKGISVELFQEEGFQKIADKEKEFQHSIQGERKALCEIRHQIGNPALSLDYILDETSASKPALQIYEDTGKGFNEPQSYFVSDMRRCGKEVEFSIKLNRDLINLRIDPTNRPCVIILRSVKIEGKEVLPELMKKKLVKHGHNGKLLKNDAMLFANDDPHFAWKIKDYLPADGRATMQVSMRIENISAETAIRLC